MARPNKYESHIKPYFDDIKDALERGVEEKQIAKGCGVSVSAWCDYKNKYSEFNELFKKKDTTKILKQLDGALMRSALGFKYKETKQYLKESADGRDAVIYTEVTEKEQPPNVTAIFGAYNRFDPDYKKDAAYYRLREQELQLKKAIAEANNFDLSFNEEKGNEQK